MQNLRIGSIVNVTYQLPNGSGGFFAVNDSNMTVTNITGTYIEYTNAAETVKSAVPWSTLNVVSVTTP